MPYFIQGFGLLQISDYKSASQLNEGRINTIKWGLNKQYSKVIKGKMKLCDSNNPVLKRESD